MIDPVSSVNIAGAGGAGSAAADRARQADESATGFGESVGDALTGLGRAEAAADQAALAGATGDLTSVSDYMIAATEAQLVTEVTAAVRNRAIESFNEIMRMQV